jgi:putative transposase
MKYPFITEHRQEFSMTTLCRVLQVSVSGDSAWQKRAASRRRQEDAVLSERMGQLYQANRQVSGSPRIHVAKGPEGHHCGKKRVARLMRSSGRSRQTSSSSHSHNG